MNNAREMQKQAAKSAKDAGKNKGKSETHELLQEKKAERRVLMWNKQFSSQREGCDCDTHTPSLKKYILAPPCRPYPQVSPPLFFPLGVEIKHSMKIFTGISKVFPFRGNGPSSVSSHYTQSFLPSFSSSLTHTRLLQHSESLSVCTQYEDVTCNAEHSALSLMSIPDAESSFVGARLKSFLNILMKW